MKVGRVPAAVVVAALTFAAVFAASTAGCAKAGNASGDSGLPEGVGGGPYLTELSVSATSNPSLTLVPPFAPGTHDYYVLCAAGTNALSVSMTASSGDESQLLQPSQSHPSPSQILSLRVNEDEAIVAVAARGTETTEYWVRCLPHDFQPIQMVQHPELGAPVPGYYLVGDQSAPASGAPPYAMVVDTNGVPVWYYRQSQTTPFFPATGIFDMGTAVSGSISFIPWHSIESTSPFEIHQLSPLKTIGIAVPGVALNPHELRPLPNGDFLLFTDQTQTGVDLTGYGVNQPNGEPFGPNSDIFPCDILEVDTAGNLIWEWIGTDHFDSVKDSTLPETGNGPTGVLAADPFHCNSIDVDPTNGNLLVSARNMDSIFYVEKPSGKVLWKMGGATYSKDNAKYIPLADPFYRQHDARLQPGWSDTCGGQGQISLFDDESVPVRTSDSPPSRAVVLEVNVGAGGGACGAPTATVAWQRAGSIDSWLMGSFRILPDGSRTIGWGFAGQPGLVFTEVDIHGNDLLDFYFTDGSSSYRSIKVPLSALDLDLLRSTAGKAAPLGTGVAGGAKDDADVDAALGDDAREGTDGGAFDASLDSGEGQGTGAGCYVVSGTGGAQQCFYTASTALGFTCSSAPPGSAPGSCPSSGLVGCCVGTQFTDGGEQDTTATCYYSSSDAADASAQCDFDLYQGMPVDWQTTAP
jgi:hypothetical protein